MALNIQRDSFTENLIRLHGNKFTFKDTLLDDDKYSNINPEVLRSRFDLGELSTSIWLGTGECTIRPAYFDDICKDQISFYTYFLQPGLDGVAAFFYALSQNNSYIQLHMVEDCVTDAFLRAEKIKGTDLALFYASYYCNDEMSMEAVIDVTCSVEKFRDNIRKYVLRENFHEELRQAIQDWCEGDPADDYYYEIRGEFLTWKNICQMNWLFDDSEKQEIKIESYVTPKQLEEIIEYEHNLSPDFLRKGRVCSYKKMES